MGPRGEQVTDASRYRFRGRWLSLGGTVIGVSALIWVLGRVDYDRLLDVLRRAEVAPLLAVPLAVAAEQLIRAWKWRQLLHEIRSIGSLRLFGAIMAGYFATMLIPLGISPLVRSWLIARLEGLKMSTVLATAAIDRLVDGLMFCGFVALALALAAVPETGGGIRLGLLLGGLGSFLGFSALLYGLSRFKARAGEADAWPARLAARLPERFADPLLQVLRAFAEGVVWPRQHWRGLTIVLASATMKLVSLTHFFWAGLGFGVVLDFADYLFLLVFFGFLLIISRITRIPGGFFLGAVFALDLLGVAEEQALAMVLVVQVSTVVTVSMVGAFALWRSGLALDDLKAAAPAAAEA